MNRAIKKFLFNTLAAIVAVVMIELILAAVNVELPNFAHLLIGFAIGIIIPVLRGGYFIEMQKDYNDKIERDSEEEWL